MEDIKVFALAPGIAEAIMSHARAGYPDEVCGIIAGTAGTGLFVYPGRNVSPNPRSAFELDPETLALQIDFEDRGLELAAIYHSHPAGPGTPSATDIALAGYPQAVYLICSLARIEAPVLRAFRIFKDEAREIPLISFRIC